MSDNSHIQWTQATWNFLVGCTKKSLGCMGCYAILVAWRLMHNPNLKIAKKFEGTVHRDSKGDLNWTGRINFDDEVLSQPLRWREPRMIFVNSLSDFFHPNVKDEWIDAAFAVMALCPQHTFQILTKHPERGAHYFYGDTIDEQLGVNPSQQLIRAYGERRQAALDSRMDAIGEQAYDRFGKMFSSDAGGDDFVQFDLPLANVQILTSIEDQPTANERIPWLLRIPAVTLGLSIEPLLGPIDLGEAHPCGYYCDPVVEDNSGYVYGHHDHDFKTPGVNTRIGWVIVGGESGPKARGCDLNNIKSIVEQCKAAEVPVFVKQLGAKPFMGVKGFGPVVLHRKGGDITEFPDELKVREFPK